MLSIKLSWIKNYFLWQSIWKYLLMICIHKVLLVWRILAISNVYCILSFFWFSVLRLKVLSGHSNCGVTRLIRYGTINWRPGKFKNFFIDKVSREEHKTIYSGLRISGMALFNQSDLPAFFSPRTIAFKPTQIPLFNILVMFNKTSILKTENNSLYDVRKQHYFGWKYLFTKEDNLFYAS